MASKKVCDTVFELASPLAEQNNCFVDDVEFKKEGSDYVLRVILDVESDENGGISINQCENVSRALSDILDEKDPIEQAYMLEVTSPGLDRSLKKERDFVRFQGRDIDIGFYKPVNGSKTLSGKLKDFSDGIVTVETENGEEKIDKSDTAYIKLAVIW